MSSNKSYNILSKNNLIIYFFLFLIINYAFFNYRILFRENGYILADWLINYSGGFVRRGLMGHFFYLISKSFNLSIIHFIFFFSTTIYISSIYFFYNIVKDKLDNNLVLIFLFLPSTFLFNFFDPLTVGRKEILVFFFFSFYYLNLDKIIENINYKILIFFLSIVTILTHEIMFFSIPYIFAIKYLHIIKKIKKFDIKDYYLEILIFICSLILMVAMVVFSNNHDNDILCNSVTDVGLSTDVCYGTIREFGALKNSTHSFSFSNLTSYFIQKNYFINYSLYFLLSIFPLILIIFKSNNIIYKKKFVFLSIFCILFSMLFYGQVNDWGRYLNVTFLLQFLIVLKYIEMDPGIEKTKFNKKKFISLILVFFYLTTWHMPHCCNPELGKGYSDIGFRIKKRIIDNSEESTKYKDLPREYLRRFFKID
jgi:hypothetical protein